MKKIKGNLDSKSSITSASSSVVTGLNNVTPDGAGNINYPMVNKTDFTKMLNMLPISRVGTLSYLPMNVSGSFEGGTTMSYRSCFPGLLENDGTLVFLRPGTNGSTINYYYSYVNNALGTSSLKATHTNKGYFTSSSDDICMLNSDTQNVLFYQNQTKGTIGLILTNGTMDQRQHVGATLPVSSMPYYNQYALKVGTYIYVFSLYSSTISATDISNYYTNLTDPFKIIVYRIPVSEIQSGTINTIEQVSGITGTDLYGNSTNSDGIIIAPKALSNNLSDQAYAKYDTNIAGGTICGYTSVGLKAVYDGNNSINLCWTNNCYFTNSNQRKDTYVGFNTYYNVSSKSYSTNLTTGSAITATASSSTSPITISNPYEITGKQLDGNYDVISDGVQGSAFISDGGYLFTITDKYVLSDFYFIIRASIQGFTTKYSAMNVRSRTLNNVIKYQQQSSYGSVIGDNLIGAIPVSSTKVLTASNGTYNGVNYSASSSKSVADFGTTRTFTYNSVQKGTRTGYAPQADRAPVTANPAYLTYGLVSLIDAAGNCQAYGTSFVEGFKNSTGMAFNATSKTFTGVLNVQQSAYDNARNAVISAQNISGYTTTRLALYYVPDSSYTSSIGMLYVTYSNMVRIYIFGCTCTVSNSTITNITYNTFYNMDQVSPAFSVSSGSPYYKGGLVVAKYSDFTFIGFDGTCSLNVPGDTNERTYAYSASTTGVVDSTSFLSHNSYHTAQLSDNYWYSAIPNYGFGCFIFGNNDFGTKLIFRQFGNTQSAYANLKNLTNYTDTVILAQDVAQGFQVYFTEEVPVLVSGSFYKLPISTIDLLTIKANPANTTFYGYVQIVNGVCKYTISTTVLPEDLNTIFFCTIVTDASRISSISAEKVTRFMNYRLSTTNKGSAIPVSTGAPTDSNVTRWKN
ncbi:structural protein [Xanthomonas phage XaC1]|nr:structural protein [Xanthomonas phage XaC1]